MLRRTIPATLAVAALGLAGAAPGALARHGADDPAGHDAGDDHGVHSSVTHRSSQRRGVHHHRGTHQRHGGHDDGPNHT
ncbi:MAG: hypothetical protein JWR30_2933 [Conexibacter sp.]|jgi:hypothetical protein|nr:hypothetical protein [Conexibacter sp.]MDX6715235.1 hypothetical protein [Baekduia sp.]